MTHDRHAAPDNDEDDRPDHGCSTTACPKVSILMLTYNQEQFLAQALDSVLMQAVDFEYEVILSDDCSTDRTPEIAKAYAEQYGDRVRLLLNPTNLGIFQNFVQAFTACRGQYLALLEGDDYWTSPQKLQTQVNFLDQHPDYAICFHRALYEFEGKELDPMLYYPEDIETTTTIDDLLKWNYIPTASVMYRRECVTEIPPWFGKLKMMDWLLHLWYAQQGKIGFLKEQMSVYRMHSGGAWSAQQKTWQLREIIRMLQSLTFSLDDRYAPAIATSLDRYFQMLEDEVKQSIQANAEIEITQLQQQVNAWENAHQERLGELAQAQASHKAALLALENVTGSFQETYASWQQSQEQLQRTQAELNQMRKELKRSHHQLKQAGDRITAMESSKFWQLRQAWLRLKNFGSPIE